MPKKLKLLYILLFISVAINVYFGIRYYIKSTYMLNLDDQGMLAAWSFKVNNIKQLLHGKRFMRLNKA